MSDKCRVYVPTGVYWPVDRPCGRPAKGTLASGTPACGIHMAAERRRAEKQAKRTLMWKKRAAAEKRADALSAVLGIYIPVDLDADFARVHFADLERLAEELVALRAQAQGRKA